MNLTEDTSLHLSRVQQSVELVRPWILFSLYLVSASMGWWLLAVPVAVATGLAGFVQMHDAIHRSLGVSKRGHDLVMFASGLLLLKSGHGLQITHLRHHGRCLKHDDPEGACATWPFWRVSLVGPLHLFKMRSYSIRNGSNTRRLQIAETAATVCLVAAAVGIYVFLNSWIGIIYWATAAAMSATIPIWAAYIPHRLAPENPAVRSVSRVAQIWTPVLSSFAFHHLHHAFPKVPTALLPVLAQRPEAAAYKVHIHVSED
jgi:fatty acid desaturase